MPVGGERGQHFRSGGRTPSFAWFAAAVACVGLVAGLLPGVASAVPPAEGNRALAWGEGGYGSLGDGNYPDDSMPVQVVGGANTPNTWQTSWSSLDGGWDQTCGVGGDDSAYCWGRNRMGQLGNGTTDHTNVPVRVVGGPVSWVSVSAGSDESSCGVGSDDSAYCWGKNNVGQLGNGTTNNNANVLPVRVSGGPARWASVRVGKWHACGLGTDDSAYCWGWNANGQLGDGSRLTRTAPVRVSGGPSSWTSVSAGQDHSCGVGDDSAAYCWGGNSNGQLGDDTTTRSTVPVPVSAGENSSLTWKSVAAGQYASCGVGGDDSAYCWGWNSDGQLGNGGAGDSLVPDRVHLPAGVKVRMIAMDSLASHVCALSLDDTAYCWGNNNSGQLGNGNKPTDSSVPVLVQFNADLAAGIPKMIAVGGYTSFVVSTFGMAPAPVPSPPPPVFPPGPPTEVTASPADRSAAVSWAAPTSTGSYPITHYQAVSQPGGRTCLTPAPATSCTMPGLTNGTTYTFTVTALNGAGWGTPSTPSGPVTPTPPPVARIVLDQGTRTADGRQDRILTAGTTTAIPAAAQLIVYLRFDGQDAFSQGRVPITVNSDGTFTWTRTVRKNRELTAYLTWQTTQSNTVSWPTTR